MFLFLCGNKSRSFTSFYMSHKILTKDMANFLKAKVNTSRSPQRDFFLFWQSRPHILCVQCKDMYSWALQVWFQPTDSVSCLPLPMLSGIKAEMSQNSPSLLPHKITSVYQLHVNPSGLSFIFRGSDSCVENPVLCTEREMERRSQIGVTSLCFIHRTYVAVVFRDRFREQSTPISSSSITICWFGDWRMVGWSSGRERGGVFRLQACLRGTLTRQSHQTASSGYRMTPNTHRRPCSHSGHFPLISHSGWGA